MNEPQASGHFPSAELATFLALFLDGILNEGLMQPLEKWFASRTGPIADSARAWHRALARGESPEVALGTLSPGFPGPTGELLTEAFKSGELDYVLRDMIAVLAAGAGRAGLESMLADYRGRPKGSSICAGCVEREIDRIARRAAVEDAREVIVRWDAAGFMEQRFVAAYVVTVRQPSRESIVVAIGRALRNRDLPFKVHVED